MNVDDAIELANKIIDLSEELPDEAVDFAISVSEKASDMLEFFEKRGYCTEKQYNALSNMLKGVENWLH